MIKGHATSRPQERLESLHVVNSSQEFNVIGIAIFALCSRHFKKPPHLAA